MNVIELIGPPGAGKTTLLPVVRQICRRHGISAMNVNEAKLLGIKTTLLSGKYLNVLPQPAAIYLARKFFRKYMRHRYQQKFVLNNTFIFRQVVDSQTERNIFIEHKKKIIKWFLLMGGHYQFFQENLKGGDTLIFDEGFAHKVISLYVSENEQVNGESIKRYLDILPKIKLIIKINANLQICKQRLLSQRLKSRLANKSEHDIAQFIANSIDAIDITTRHLTKGGVPVIEVDNDRDFKITCRRMKVLLTNHFRDYETLPINPRQNLTDVYLQ